MQLAKGLLTGLLTNQEFEITDTLKAQFVNQKPANAVDNIQRLGVRVHGYQGFNTGDFDVKVLLGEPAARLREAGADDLHLPLEVGMVEPVVVAAALQRVVHLASAVARHDDDRGDRRLDGSKLRHADREVGEHLEQEGLELVVGAVDLVDQQQGAVPEAQRLQQRAGEQEALVVQLGLVVAGALARRLDGAQVQQLTGVVPGVQRLGAVEKIETPPQSPFGAPEAAREVLAEDATFREGPDGFRSVEDLELAFEFHQGYAIQVLSGECDVKAASPESVVIGCDYMSTTELQRIIDYPPVPGSVTFTVQEGLITRVINNWNPGEFNPNVYNPWINDFLSEHPEFRALALASHGLPPEPTREFLDLLPQYLQLYEEWVNTHEG